MVARVWNSKQQRYIEPWWEKWDIALVMLLLFGSLVSATLGIWNQDERWGATAVVLGAFGLLSAITLVRRG